MSEHFGAPGIGGSLGECAVCAKPFIAELLLGTTVTNFKVSGILQVLSAHTETCVPLLKECAGDKWRDLPPQSAIRKAFEQHEIELAAREEAK